MFLDVSFTILRSGDVLIPTPKTFGQLAKYTSAMYAEMLPTEKEAWAERAEADKARYLHQLTTYTPPPGMYSCLSMKEKGCSIWTNNTFPYLSFTNMNQAMT